METPLDGISLLCPISRDDGRCVSPCIEIISRNIASPTSMTRVCLSYVHDILLAGRGFSCIYGKFEERYKNRHVEMYEIFILLETN